MQKSDFWYDLPQELIAQTPLEDRSSSKLLVVDRKTGALCDKTFTDIVDYLQPGDCLVMNDTKVIPARVYGVKCGSTAKIEMLLLRETEKDVWEVLLKPGKRMTEGCEAIFGDELKATVLSIEPDGNRICRLSYNGDSLLEVINRIGEMPLPHYIHEHLDNPDRYQTVYAEKSGSVAAPTAGLHFTPELLKKLRDKGVNTAYLTLHVGIGTFRPVKENDITHHIMHSEYYMLSQETADAVNAAKSAGKRVISVGTTSCRTLEAVWKKHGKIVKDSDFTDIFIYPPYKFGCIDGLITNFHLPESTLVMLVSAFAGRENVLNAYRHAIDMRYRFFSFGDACLFI